ncbi:hypothetical protein K469DRAFT_747833 [Zopfia rhizophila CBS 207.26]|uniref:Uncharacterized protein n=1 Tax=Zopfia rhizophila CBS 207.26 TaxID=1314779 RepID=A0A6A6EDN7_9PEZI|nr:hypothetical protein K469DRAFT_747833 [Zopfia rhizophila CBS 207.26]
MPKGIREGGLAGHQEKENNGDAFSWSGHFVDERDGKDGGGTGRSAAVAGSRGTWGSAIASHPKPTANNTTKRNNKGRTRASEKRDPLVIILKALEDLKASNAELEIEYADFKAGTKSSELGKELGLLDFRVMENQPGQTSVTRDWEVVCHRESVDHPTPTVPFHRRVCTHCARLDPARSSMCLLLFEEISADEDEILSENRLRAPPHSAPRAYRKFFSYCRAMFQTSLSKLLRAGRE